VEEASVAPDGGIGGANAAIHDDFETQEQVDASGSLGTWQLTDVNGNAATQYTPVTTVTLDATDPAHSGTHSVKITGGGFLSTKPPAPAFYGRMWVLLASNPSPGRGSGPHWGWIHGEGPSLEGGTTAVQVRMGGQFGILEDNYSPNDDIVLSDPNVFNDSDGGTPPPIGVWTCVEFYYGKDSLRTWINGTEIVTMDVTPSTAWGHGATHAPWSPAYDAIRMGYAGYNGNAINLQIDDVALDPNQIGCN
jgi:hypothetical protein